jgi:hypothetical protein
VEGGVTQAPSCGAPDVVMLVDGTTVHRSYDLRTAPHGLSIGCNDLSSPANAGKDAGQVVYELVVPGTGPHAIVATTEIPGTDRSIDTLIGIRTASCFGSASDQCFDDVGQDTRARADFLANGGDHVFVILTTYSHGQENPVAIDFTSKPNAEPSLASASALIVGEELLVDVAGGDPDGNGWGVIVRFHGPAGELIDLDGNGIRNAADRLSGPFSRSVQDVTMFSERARLPISAAQAGRIGGATMAYVRAQDQAGAVSLSDVVTPVMAGAVALHGQPCDANNVCSEELNCSAGMVRTCQPTATRQGACTAAMTLAVPTPTTSTTTSSAMGVLMLGTGLFQGNCGNTLGTEDIYSVSVPMGAFDLVLTTENPGTAMGADTVIYVRSDCVEPLSEGMGWCNDDDTSATPTSLLSRLVIEDIPQGSYAVFVESYQGVLPDMMLRYELSASLRPVLPSGAHCDPAEVMNRCAGMACTGAGTCP